MGSVSTQVIAGLIVIVIIAAWKKSRQILKLVGNVVRLAVRWICRVFATHTYMPLWLLLALMLAAAYARFTWWLLLPTIAAISMPIVRVLWRSVRSEEDVITVVENDEEPDSLGVLGDRILLELTGDGQPMSIGVLVQLIPVHQAKIRSTLDDLEEFGHVDCFRSLWSEQWTLSREGRRYVVDRGFVG